MVLTPAVVHSADPEFVATEAGGPVELQSLLDAFVRSPGLEADFVEVKHIAMLTAPRRSTGKLYYAKPGLLARVVSEPVPSTFVVDSDQVRIFDGERWKTIQLKARPMVRGFAHSLLSILQGDRAALDAAYTLEWNPETDGRWALVLRPRLAPMDQVIDRLELQGRQLSVSGLKVIEKAGDATITSFSSVNPARTYSEAERAQLFRAEEP